MYYVLENDNGNSKHKIMINNELFTHPNIYAILHNPMGEVDKSLEDAVKDLHKRIDVRIESKALGPDSQRYLIGQAALEVFRAEEVYNMDVMAVRKHEEDVPIINTLGIIAVKAVQDRYKEAGTLKDSENIDVLVDMTTALPVSNHNAKNQKAFQDRWLNGPHDLKVYVKDLSINVKISFRVVKVLQEGVPAIFTIFEDADGNYRDDNMFKEFQQQYKEELNSKINGEYFIDKRLLHFDIGDGSTEAVFTEGYSVDVAKSEGEKFGLGQALEKAAVSLGEKMNIKLTRQKMSEYLQMGTGTIHPRNKIAKDSLQKPMVELIDKKLMKFLQQRLETLTYEVDVVVVYGGASILLKDAMYPKVLKFCETFGIKVLWIPQEFAVEMTVRGMKMYNNLKMEELIAETQETVNN